MPDRWRTKTKNNHNVNNTATRHIHGGKTSMFSRNIFGGTLNIDIVKPSMKKKFHLLQKPLEDDMTETVNKCVKLESKLQLKCFIVLKFIVYLWQPPIDQGQWPLNTTADCGGFPYRFSVTYWLAEWRCSMESLVLNWFIQMKYLLAQIKIFIVSFSLTK